MISSALHKVYDAHLDWAKILLVLWGVIFAASYLERMAPASDWLYVTTVQVDDAVVLEAPIMHVQREIRRAFKGTWAVDVEQLQPNGQWEQLPRCTSEGVANYAPDNALPEKLDLDWWTYPVQCTLFAPGTYRVETVWEIELPGGVTKDVRVISNSFKVKAPSQGL